MHGVRLRWLPAVAALLLLVGCGAQTSAGTTESPGAGARGGAGGTKEAWISVGDYLGPQSIGILMAKELGFFEDLGIDMAVTSAATPDGPIQYVQDEVVEFGVTRQPEVVLAAKEGPPITAVGALISRPTEAMIWLKKSGIDGISDLKGKTIAIPGLPFQEDFLQGLLEKNGLSIDDVELKRVGYRLARTLASGQADAIFGGSWNMEGAALAARHLKPVITRVPGLGLPAYDEQVLVARDDLISRDPRLVEDVLAAVARGTAVAVEHPEAAIKLIEKGVETDPHITLKGIEAEVGATLPLLSESGYMSTAQAADLVDRMHEEGWIKRRVPIPELLTDDHLSLEP
jgi:ABC-type nitrate/sulfonate/bicarbonate transport system substrate-binding protein